MIITTAATTAAGTTTTSSVVEISTSTYDYTGKIDVTGRTEIQFEVKSIGDAHILLTSDNGSVFEIGIGVANNAETVIRGSKLGSNIVTVNGVCLDENQYIRFKLRWVGANLVLERATENEIYGSWMTLTQWQSYGSKNTIEQMDVASYGTSADWKIYLVSIGWLTIICTSKLSKGRKKS